MLTEVFWTVFITSVIGCLIGIARMFYKSKCKSISCCAMRIDRDVEAENKIDELTTIRRNNSEDKSHISI